VLKNHTGLVQPWTADDDRRIAEMLAEGKTRSEIAFALDRTFVALKTRIIRRRIGLQMAMMWSQEEDELLTRMIEDGYAFSAIAPKVGKSRNACIGRAARLGLQQPEKAHGRTVTRSRASPAPQRKTSPVACKRSWQPIARRPEPDLTIRSNPVTLIELKDRHCRWPIGDPREPDFCFCGDAAGIGEAYCAGHMAMAYTTPAQRAAAIRMQEAAAKWAGPRRAK
jgi:GcrA cell cycle regulator